MSGATICICGGIFTMCEDGHAIDCPASNQFDRYKAMMNGPAACLTTPPGIMSGAVEGVALLPMSEAPKDGTYIIAYYRSLDNDRTKHWSGRAFVIRHEGQTVSDYDLGWALFPGYDGVPDHCFAGWSPLPSALTTPPARSYADGVRDSAKVVEALEKQVSEVIHQPGLSAEVLMSTVPVLQALTHCLAAIRLLSQGEKA